MPPPYKTSSYSSVGSMSSNSSQSSSKILIQPNSEEHSTPLGYIKALLKSQGPSGQLKSFGGIFRHDKSGHIIFPQKGDKSPMKMPNSLDDLYLSMYVAVLETDDLAIVHMIIRYGIDMHHQILSHFHDHEPAIEHCRLRDTFMELNQLDEKTIFEVHKRQPVSVNINIRTSQPLLVKSDIIRMRIQKGLERVCWDTLNNRSTLTLAKKMFHHTIIGDVDVLVKATPPTSLNELLVIMYEEIQMAKSLKAILDIIQWGLDIHQKNQHDQAFKRTHYAYLLDTFKDIRSFAQEDTLKDKSVLDIAERRIRLDLWKQVRDLAKHLSEKYVKEYVSSEQSEIIDALDTFDDLLSLEEQISIAKVALKLDKMPATQMMFFVPHKAPATQMIDCFMMMVATTFDKVQSTSESLKRLQGNLKMLKQMDENNCRRLPRRGLG